MICGQGSLRRGVYKFSKYTVDNLELVVPTGQRARAEFEDKFGAPTNIDQVWIAREQEQANRNALRVDLYSGGDHKAAEEWINEHLRTR